MQVNKVEFASCSFRCVCVRIINTQIEQKEVSINFNWKKREGEIRREKKTFAGKARELDYFDCYYMHILYICIFRFLSLTQSLTYSQAHLL